jgi:hypothetical protein
MNNVYAFDALQTNRILREEAHKHRAIFSLYMFVPSSTSPVSERDSLAFAHADKEWIKA